MISLNGRGIIEYPERGMYNSNADCSWRIQVATGMVGIFLIHWAKDFNNIRNLTNFTCRNN